MLKIRLSKILKKEHFFKIILIDSKKPREGKPIENIGFYNNLNKKKIININKVIYWKKRGAILTKTVKKIFINEFTKINRK